PLCSLTRRALSSFLRRCRLIVFSTWFFTLGGQMRRLYWRLRIGLLQQAACAAGVVSTQRLLTWQGILEKFNETEPRRRRRSAAIGCVALAWLLLAACQSKEKIDMAAAAPPKTEIVEEPDLNTIKVDRPERFVLVNA